MYGVLEVRVVSHQHNYDSWSNFSIAYDPTDVGILQLRVRGCSIGWEGEGSLANVTLGQATTVLYPVWVGHGGTRWTHTH